MTTLSNLIQSEIADFFAGFGGPGEPDIQSGEAQRQLTERVLDLLRKEREAAVPVVDSDKCDPDVFENGRSACLVAISKDDAETICRGISAATGCRVDWHYVGGRVHIKALYAAPPAQPVAVPDELLSAMEEVLRISDRDHEAWHRVRDGIASCRAAMLNQAPVKQPASNEGQP